LWSFAWWLEGQHLGICLAVLASYKYVTPTP
jgi:hypothetical protein